MSLCFHARTYFYPSMDKGSLVTRPILAPSQNGLAHQLELLGLIAECLSTRQLIVRRGLKSQLAYIYICMCATSVTLRNAIESWVTFRILYYMSRSVMLSAPGATQGASMCLRWRRTSYMDAAFVLLAHEGSEIRTNRSLLFTQVALLQL